MTGIVGSRDLLEGIPQAVYVCDKTNASVINLNVCNRGNLTTLISVAISNSATAPTNAQWIEFDSQLIPKGTLERTGMLINPGQYLIVKSSRSSVNAVAWGITSGEVVPSVPAITQNQGGAPTWAVPITETNRGVVSLAGATTSITTGSWDVLQFVAEAARTYSLVSGSLPTGARFEPDTGRMYNFTLPGSTTTSSFTLRATSPTGFTADRAFSLSINTSPIPTPPPPVIGGGGGGAPVVVVTTTGGTISTSGGYQIHTYTDVGATTFVISSS
jgi:hypothetical protein